MGVLSATSSRAAQVDYTINSQTSFLTLSQTLLNGALPMFPQYPGSDTSKLQGTISVNRVGTTLTFNGGSTMDALPFLGGSVFPSAAQTGSGSLETNYAFQDSLDPENFGFLADDVIRDAVADWSSGSATFGGAVTNLQFAFTGGTIDYYDGFNDVFDFIPMTDLLPQINQSAGTLGRVVNGNTETITIPFSGRFYFDVLFTNDSYVDTVGQIIASRTIPTFVLGDMNGDGLLNNFDLQPLEIALTNPAAYLSVYHQDDYDLRGDVDQNGSLNNFDIQPLERLLTNQLVIPGAFGASVSIVPEPTGFVLFAFGLLMLSIHRVRRAAL